jgi:hydrogenase-4 component F
MDIVLVALLVVPLVAILVSAFAPPRVAGLVTIVSGAISLALTLALVPAVGKGAVHVGFLRADALSVVFLLATAFLYFVVALYAYGYLDGERHMDGFTRYTRLFLTGLNIFAWSMLCAPVMDGLALLWVAIEITTIVSALLVAIDDTDGATEAAWKYVLLASTGLGIALLATIFMYYAGATSLGTSYDLAFAPLLQHARELPEAPVKLAFVLAVIGYGTKVGLVPMHTWLPDAHAEAPTPVSALLSGALLAVSFYAVLRYYQVASGTLGPHFPAHVLVVFGVASLLLAAIYVLGQRDVKRLLAYSSVEHMGILAIGVSFGAPVAAAGVFLHILAHAAAKGGAFMGAGVLMRAFHTKDLDRIRNAMGRLPLTAPVFLALLLGLSGLPPSGIFRSELMVIAGGFSSHHGWVAATLIILVTVAFVGVITAMTRVICAPAAHTVDETGENETGGETVAVGLAGSSPRHTSVPGQVPEQAPGQVPEHVGGQVDDRGSQPPGVQAAPRTDARGRRAAEPSYTMLVAMAICLLALVVLGVHPPDSLVTLIHTASNQLIGAGSV